MAKCESCENYVEVTVALGECHCYAPEPVVTRQWVDELALLYEEDQFTVVHWPRVTPDDKCGEYRSG